MKEWNANFGPRLAQHVSAKLGCRATFVRFDRNEQTGADTPVFAIPAKHIGRATALGLRVMVQPLRQSVCA